VIRVPGYSFDSDTNGSAQFTPGPWLLETLDGRIPAIREVKRPHGEASTYAATIRTTKREHVCKLDFGYGHERLQVDTANAHLIAAAADLYAALKAVVTDAVGGGAFRNLTGENAAAALAAIAKAEGK
jgi:hypothetical protein